MLLSYLRHWGISKYFHSAHSVAGTVFKCFMIINSLKFYPLEKQISKKQTILRETFSQKPLDKANYKISTTDVQILQNSPSPF